ncbi:uncharacterized protein LOC131303080 [Rhododendron vialii]|uniref:uncharacterized protein LOC131303080 n=1 Tax=Rhododendron vialii TaxID=182163 RepID=UPI00265E54DD|nr:uncharacterized protein LOC131303080 [Rhododendron vialii]
MQEQFNHKGVVELKEEEEEIQEEEEETQEEECYKCKKFGHVKKDCKAKSNLQAKFSKEKNGEGNLFYDCQVASEYKNEVWYLDSGCSNHMTGDQSIFLNMDTLAGSQVKMGNGALNLLSVGQLLEHGYAVHFEAGSCTIHDKDDRSQLVAKRLGQLNFHGLKLLQQKIMVQGLSNIEEVHDVLRRVCTWEAPSKAVSKRGFLESKRDAGISSYGCIWSYENSIACWKQKFKNMVEKQSGYYIKTLRSDRGKEYNSKEFDKFCEDECVEMQLTMGYTPQQSGVFERKIQTVMETAKSMLHEKRLPKIFWAEVVYTAVYLINRSQLKGYKLYNLKTNQIIISRDVMFDENASWNWEQGKVEKKCVQVNEEQGSAAHEGEDNEGSPQFSPRLASPSSPRLSPSSSSSSSTPSSTPIRMRSLSDVYAQCNFCMVEPESFEEAIKNETWIKAMEEELNEIFAPVARPDTIRALIAAQKGWSLYQLDIKSTFLKGELKEEVYIEQPQVFVTKREEDKVYRLKKTLYRLKQAPIVWYSQIDSYFNGKGFKRSKSDSTLYVKTQGTSILIVALYVDDLLFTGDNEEMILDFKKQMMQCYEMSDMGLLHHFLGIEIYQIEEGVFISQKQYAKNILKKFGMNGCKPVATPLIVNEKLMKEDGEKKVDATLYRHLVGKLLYLTVTRPNIMYAVSLLSRFMNNPSQNHLGAAKRVLRYIRGKTSYEIKYCREADVKLFGFCDSDWGGCIDDMKSTSGYIFSLGSGVFSWGLKEEEGTEIFCDNKSTIEMAKNPIFNSRTRHIAIKHHFI